MALSAFEDVAPESGVRLSDAHLLVEEPANDAVEPASVDDGLSFKVYTLADLERRSDAPVSMGGARMSIVCSPPEQVSVPTA